MWEKGFPAKGIVMGLRLKSNPNRSEREAEARMRSIDVKFRWVKNMMLVYAHLIAKKIPKEEDVMKV